MKPYNFYKPRVVINYPTEQAFAAAVLAYDTGASDATPGIYDASNKTRAAEYLESKVEFSETVLARAQEVMQYYQGLSFSILAGKKLSPLNQKLMNLASGDTVTNLDIGAISFAPQGYKIGKSRIDLEDRIRYAAGGLLGTPGDKFVGTVEVLRCVFSANYGVYFVTAATQADNIIYFAVKREVSQGSKIAIRGSIKAHKEKQTQLNRVKIDRVENENAGAVA